MTKEIRTYVIQMKNGLFLTDTFGEFLSPNIEHAKQHRTQGEVQRVLLKLGPNWQNSYSVKELLVLYTIGEK